MRKDISNSVTNHKIFVTGMQIRQKMESENQEEVRSREIQHAEQGHLNQGPGEAK